MNVKERIQQYLDFKGINVNLFEKTIDSSKSYWRNTKSISAEVLSTISRVYSDLNIDWVLTGNGDMIKNIMPIIKKETRPRIPLNAIAGSVSAALSGIKAEDCEELPIVDAFAFYNYTILVKGDSMEPEFHSGDELACLQLKMSTFIQWGRYHVLDTAQGVLVKRIYDDEEFVLCKSDNELLYKDFRIPKNEVYNLGLVVGMLRRY